MNWSYNWRELHKIVVRLYLLQMSELVNDLVVRRGSLGEFIILS